jgi:acyl-CoA thioester hydrolase
VRALAPSEAAILDATWLAACGLPERTAFLAEVVVEPVHLSAAIDHVNNVQYLAWVDRVAELHAEVLGYSRAAMKAAGVMWFVASHTIHYRAEAWLGDRIVAATWVGRLQRFTCVRQTRLLRPADSTVVAETETTWILVNLATRRPVRPPDVMQAAFASAMAAARGPESL